MNQAKELIDSIEADIERIRNLDAALLASLVARLDQLRNVTSTRVMIKPSGREFSEGEAAEIARRIMDLHKDTMKGLAAK